MDTHEALMLSSIAEFDANKPVHELLLDEPQALIEPSAYRKPAADALSPPSWSGRHAVVCRQDSSGRDAG